MPVSAKAPEVSQPFWTAMVLGLCLVLGACSSVPLGPSKVERSNKGSTTAKAGKGDAPYGWEPVQKGGGYYLDDGPGDQRPVNLADMPDPVPDVEPINPANTRPYEVMGQTFTPQSSLDEPYKETGRASWYGRKFHGAKTANGEIYDMYQMTAAHPTLPLPSYAKVTNLTNGRSVIVRVNDRGPFLRSRIIDLSYAAALKLDLIKHGSAEVQVEKLTPDLIAQYQAKPQSGPAQATAVANATPVNQQVAPAQAAAAQAVAVPPSGSAGQAAGQVVAKPVMPVSTAAGSASAPKNVFLQLGAFGQQVNAQALKNDVLTSNAELGKNTQVLMKEGLYRVIVGPFQSVEQANEAAIQLTASVTAKPVIKEDLILP